MEIRLLQAADVDQVRTFLFSIIKNDFGYDYNPEWHKDIDELTQMYLAERACFYIAIKNDEIIGAIGARPFDKTYPELKGRYLKEDTLSIWRHYIHPQYRRQRIGSRLVDYVESFAKEQQYKQIYLHTQRAIPGSLEYWLAKGYSITNESVDEFQTVHMDKILIRN
jgi:ribosomal protein S18 acetylase RimI-like enzyme